MKKKLEFQADKIEAVLTQHNAPGRVAGGTVTPRWIRFKVFPKLGTEISAMKSLSEELAAALDAPSCRMARRGAAVMVEIPREDSRDVELLPLIEELDDVPAMTAALGISDDGAPLLIRLTSPDVKHILVSGEKGAGKTSLLRTIAISLALRHPRRGELAMTLIESTGHSFTDLMTLPHLTCPPATPQNAFDVLEALAVLVERREVRGDMYPPLVVIADDLDRIATSSLSDDPLYCLEKIVKVGHSVGVHLVAAVEKPSAPTIEALVKADFPVRIVGKVASAQDARVASGWPGTGAERLLKRGDFIAVAEGRTHRFQAAYIHTNEIGHKLDFRRSEDLPGSPQVATIPLRLEAL